MKIVLNKLFSKIKIKVEIEHFPNEGIDLDNLCQSTDSVQPVNIDLYKQAGVLVVRNILSFLTKTRAGC